MTDTGAWHQRGWGVLRALAVMVGVGFLLGTAALAPVRTPVAAASTPVPTVGVLLDADGQNFCTASVVHSPGGDLVLTAAHCVSGDGAGVGFAPGYSAGSAPFGVWRVVAAYAPPGWLSSTDPAFDVALLRVAPAVGNRASRTVEQVVGGGERVGGTPPDGTTVTVHGYPSAGAGLPRADCTTRVVTRVTEAGAVPSFGCAGFYGGTSGGPWLTAARGGGTAVVGVIGGYHQGGCDPDTSYSPPLGATVRALVVRAAASVRSDVLPVAPDGGC